MKKNRNNTKNKQKNLTITSICAIIVIIFIFALYTWNKNKFYKVINNVEKLEKVQKKGELKDADGWLMVQGTNIDFPILKYDSTKKFFWDGTTTLGWTLLETKSLTNKITIFSHNIRNVSSQPLIAAPNHKKFEQLMSYIYTDFVKKNKYIEFTIGKKNYVYKIFSVSFVHDSTINAEKNKYTKTELTKYIKQSVKDSYFDFDVDVNSNDKIITLVTCTRFFGYEETDQDPHAFKIDARLVRFGEGTGNYDVKEKSNYKDIKKKLEGGEENEKL